MGNENILTRIHSSCLTGDALGSLRCDCGPQLRRSMAIMEEGRRHTRLHVARGTGHHLTKKLRAYILQDGGLDTYDANITLGFPADERAHQ